MDNDLKELLRSVLKEELGPVNQRLDGMDKRFDGMEQRLDGIDRRLDKMEDDVREVKLGIGELQKIWLKT
ncbi:hypothetical protein [Lysinibacillus sphaericus]|uniref:hypothetical protein n=1 Tax=Lysinibacillus sphaericus TaxID=1421 RepID=UPI003CFC8C59